MGDKIDGNGRPTVLDLRQFFSEHFMPALQDEYNKEPDEFIRRFNQPALRTRLMLDRNSGVLALVFRRLLPIDGYWLEHFYQRFADILIQEGWWYSGRRIALGLVEVENKIGEFEGTLSELLRSQARWKVAIFYANDAPDLLRYQKRIEYVFGHFRKSRFREADDTRYIVVFGPTAITPRAEIGVWNALTFESSLKEFTSLHHTTWAGKRNVD